MPLAPGEGQAPLPHSGIEAPGQAFHRLPKGRCPRRLKDRGGGAVGLVVGQIRPQLIGKEEGILGHEGQGLAKRGEGPVRKGDAIEGDGARAWLQKPGQEGQERALAGPHGPHEGEDFPRRDGQLKVLQGGPGRAGVARGHGAEVQGAFDLRGSVRARVGNFIGEIENLEEALGAHPTPLHHIHQGARGAHGLDHHGYVGEEGHEAPGGEGPLLHERSAVAEDD